MPELSSELNLLREQEQKGRGRGLVCQEWGLEQRPVGQAQQYQVVAVLRRRE